MTEERDDTSPVASPELAGGRQEPSSGDRPVGAESGGPALPAEATLAREPADPLPDVPSSEALAEVLPLVEALLFASSRPVTLEKLAEAAELPEKLVEAAVASLEEACAAVGRGVRLDRVAGGLRLVTRPEFDYPVRRLLGLDGKTKLSMAALETLAIVSYRQPVTGPEIAELRGVNSSSSLRTLLDRKLITTAGRKEVVGTPFLYKTTKEFLVHFGLKGLDDLPKPEELEAIYGLEAPRPDPAQTELFHVDEATGEVEETAGIDPGEPLGSTGDGAPPPGASSEIGSGEAPAPDEEEESHGE